MTNRPRFRWLGPALLLVAIALVFIRYQGKQSGQHDGKVFVEVKSIQTAQGWGYNILTDGKVYIHQEYIPAITGRHAFRSEADALKVGKKVVSKMGANETPSISVDELKEMGIAFDSVATVK